MSLFNHFLTKSKNLVENPCLYILDNMTNCKDLLAQELKILYPDVTDLELRQMTDNLVKFYTIAAEVLLGDEKDDVDVKNFSS